MISKKLDILLILVCRFGQVMLSFLMIKLATSLLSPASYGQLSLLTALTAGFALTLLSPVGLFINRRLHVWADNNVLMLRLLSGSFYLLSVTLFSAFIIIILQQFMNLIHGITMFWIIVVVCSSLYFNTINQTFIPAFNLFQSRLWFLILSLATLVASLCFSLLFVYILSPKAEFWQLGQNLGQAVLAVGSGIIFFHLFGKHNKVSRKEIIQPSKAMLKSVFSFAWPLSISVGLTWVQTQSYRFIVSKTIGLEALGLFVVGYGVSAAIIASFEAVLTTYFLPDFYRKISFNKLELQADAWNQYATAVLPALLLTLVFIMLFSHDLCRILLGQKFQLASQYVIYGALAEGGRVIVSTYAFIAHARMKTNKLLIPNIVGAISSLLLVFLCTIYFGISGVGIALVFASACVILTTHFVLRKQLTINIPWRSLFLASLLSLLLTFMLLIARSFFASANNFYTAAIWVLSFGVLYAGFLYGLLRKSLLK